MHPKFGYTMIKHTITNITSRLSTSFWRKYCVCVEQVHNFKFVTNVVQVIFIEKTRSISIFQLILNTLHGIKQGCATNDAAGPNAHKKI